MLSPDIMYKCYNGIWCTQPIMDKWMVLVSMLSGKRLFFLECIGSPAAPSKACRVSLNITH